MPYAIHLRKSRADLEAEARGEGESLARHKKTLLDLAARRGYDVAEIYSEGVVSGDRLSERPEMQRLLADVALGKYDGVLDVEIARLTRGDPMDQGRILMTFKYSGCKVITPDRIYDLADDYDEDYLQTDMIHARRELKYTKKRLQRGRDTSAEEGRWQGPVPYGYTKVKIPRDKGYTLEPDPKTAPFVTMIFDMYVSSDVGGAVIADRLNALGSRTAKGSLWSANAVRQLVNNPVYCGRVTWNKYVSKPTFINGELKTIRVPNPNYTNVKGLHPGLVSEETWMQVQRIRRSHDKTRKHNGAPTRNPLAGLVYCSICGKSMIRKDNGDASGSKYDLIRCVDKACPTTSCALSIVEQTILDTLAAWLVQFAPDAPQTAPQTNAHQIAIDAAEANLARLRAQRERIFAAYEDGAYDTPTFLKRRNDKNAEIAAAQRALDDLLADSTPSPEECIRMQLPAIRNALELYAVATDPQDKNAILKSVISRVEYKKTVRCFRNMDPAKELELVVIPQFPGK